MALTGTVASPTPRAPSTLTCTTYDPGHRNQTSALQRFFSPGTRCAATANGDPCWPACHNTGSKDTEPTSAPSTRTLTCPAPGKAAGGRMTANTEYAPARPSKNTFGLPTCANAACVTINKIANNKRAFFIGATCATTSPREVRSTTTPRRTASPGAPSATSTAPASRPRTRCVLGQFSGKTASVVRRPRRTSCPPRAKAGTSRRTIEPEQTQQESRSPL